MCYYFIAISWILLLLLCLVIFYYASKAYHQQTCTHPNVPTTERNLLFLKIKHEIVLCVCFCNLLLMNRTWGREDDSDLENKSDTQRNHMKLWCTALNGRNNDTHFQIQMSFQSFIAAAWHIIISHQCPLHNVFVKIQTFNNKRK